MRHRVAHRRLSRDTQHLLALLRNQADALLRHERIVTTVAKAKELRPFVERLITIAKRGVRAEDPRGKSLAARRLVMRDLVNEDVVTKLFDQLAPRFLERPGGYTRILKLGHRRGDAAEIAQIELLGSEFDPRKAEADKREQDEAGGEEAKTSKSVGERLRAAASRLGRRKDKTQGDQTQRTKPGRPAKGPAKKGTTPRKAGGS